MARGPLDLTTKTLTGLLLLGGLGVGVYLVWRLVQSQKSKEVSTSQNVVVDIPPLKAPKAAKVKK